MKKHYIAYRGKSLCQAIRGELKSVIKAHGPITYNLIPSATKRIFGALKTHAHNYFGNSGCSNNRWLEIYKENWEQEVQDDMLTVPWADVKSIINRTIERGHIIQDFEQGYGEKTN